MRRDRGNFIGAETELNKAKEEMDDNMNKAASLRLKSIELKSQHLPASLEVSGKGKQSHEVTWKSFRRRIAEKVPV